MLDADKEDVLRRIAGTQRNIVQAQQLMLDASVELLNISAIVLGTTPTNVVAGGRASQIVSGGEADPVEESDAPEISRPEPIDPVQVSVPSETGNPVPDSTDTGSTDGSGLASGNSSAPPGDGQGSREVPAGQSGSETE